MHLAPRQGVFLCGCVIYEKSLNLTSRNWRGFLHRLTCGLFFNAKGDDAKMPYWKEMRQIAKLKKGADGSYCQTEKNVIASKEGMAYAVHAMQHKMLQLADESIERFEPQDHSVSSVTFTVNRECYERIAQEIDAFRKKIVAMASETEKADQIYHLNVQLFPMTWKLKKDEEA